MTTLDHVSLAVADLDRSIAFYHDLLGLPILGRGEETAAGATELLGSKEHHFLYADLDLGSGQILELLHFVGSRKTAGSRRLASPKGHFGLRVDRLARVLARLRESRIRPHTEPVELKAPPWWRGAKCVYVSDPDGVTVELVERPR